MDIILKERRKSIISNEDIIEIQNLLKDFEYGYYDYVGIRIVDIWYDDYNAQVGDILKPSHVWDDGGMTDKELDGTSAINLYTKIDKNNNNGYFGDRILIIGGYHASYGKDDGEIVIRNAVVLAVYDIIRSSNDEKNTILHG